MSNYIKKFNPLEMGDEEILALATGRERILEIMLKEMENCLKIDSNQHFILYGPRGIGKSFFTRLLKIHHSKSDIFSGSLFLQLPEEQDNINFTSDLLDVISTLLEGGKLADVKPKWTISPIQYQESVKRLKLAISKVAQEKKIRHIFVTQENLQVFIPKLDNIESGRFREFLSDFNQITLVGSSLRPDLDNDHSKKLYQVFKKIDINPWDEESFLKYYERKAQRSANKQEKLDQLKKSKNKIRAIVKFTGGSPRLAVVLSNLILDRNILDTTELLDGIIDDLTSYYQDITNDIPHKSKILFDMLIRRGENMSQSKLAESFDPPLDQSNIARSFNWLMENDYVVHSKQSKGNKKHFYVRDRLYVLYYQKRQVYADVPFSFIGIFVDFLTEFYSQKERQNEIAELDINHPHSKGLLYHFALKENINIDINEPSDNIKIKLMQNFKEEISKTKDKLVQEAILNFDKEEYEQAIRLFNKILKIDPKNHTIHLYLALAYNEKKEFQKSIRVIEKAITLQPKNGQTYSLLGITALLNKDYAIAIKAYKNAIILEPKSAKNYDLLGDCYFQIYDYNKAINAYLKAIKLNPNDSNIYYSLGRSFSNKSNYSKAIEAFQNGILIDPNNHLLYYELGFAFFFMNELHKASDAFYKSIELKPDFENAYLVLSVILNRIGNNFEAIEILQSGLSSIPHSYKIQLALFRDLISLKSWDLLREELIRKQKVVDTSYVLAEALSILIINNKVKDKFYLFKQTYSLCIEHSFINKYEFTTGLCTKLYKANRKNLLELIIEEIYADHKDDILFQIIVQVFQYLLYPEKYDINELHPDARTMLESINELELKTVLKINQKTKAI